MGDIKYSFMNKNYYETRQNYINYDYPAGNIYKINKSDFDMRDVREDEKNEKFIFENGKRIKLVSINKYMNNGEIKTMVEKFNLSKLYNLFNFTLSIFIMNSIISLF
jgi:hypothetical protein